MVANDNAETEVCKVCGGGVEDGFDGETLHGLGTCWTCQALIGKATAARAKIEALVPERFPTIRRAAFLAYCLTIFARSDVSAAHVKKIGILFIERLVGRKAQGQEVSAGNSGA